MSKVRNCSIEKGATVGPALISNENFVYVSFKYVLTCWTFCPNQLEYKSIFVQFYAQGFHCRFSTSFRSSPCGVNCNTISMRYDVIYRGNTLIASPRQFWRAFWYSAKSPFGKTYWKFWKILSSINALESCFFCHCIL